MTFDFCGRRSISEFVAQPDSFGVRCVMQVLNKKSVDRVFCISSVEKQRCSVVRPVTVAECLHLSLFDSVLLSAWPAGDFSPRALSPHDLSCSEQLPGTVFQEVNAETRPPTLVNINMKCCDANMIFSEAQKQLYSQTLRSPACGIPCGVGGVW